MLFARLDGLTANPQKAGLELKQILVEVKKKGNVPVEFETRLALGEIAVKAHDPSGRKHCMIWRPIDQ